MIKSLSLLLALACAVSGCSSFSKTARQQRAYQKYVQKSSATRMKQRSLFRNSQPAMPSMPMPAEPVHNAETSSQAMPSEG
jgi:uncharacterized protein YceK